MAEASELPELLLRLTRVLDPVTEQALTSAHGATLAQVAALRQLLESPASVSELARRLGVHRSSASRLVDRLVAAELATRVASPVSGREVVVACTPSGRRLARTVMRRRLSALTALVAGVPDNEQRRAVTALEALLRRLERP